MVVWGLWPEYLVINLETIQGWNWAKSPISREKQKVVVMRNKSFARRGSALIAGAAAFAIVLGGVAPAQAATTITWLTDGGPENTKINSAVVAAFQKANPGIKVTVRIRPAATAPALVKTKLATGNMEDVFTYNSGALLSAINPTKTLVDLSKESFWSNVYASYKPAVSVNGKQYGSPWGTASGGAMYYNIGVLEKAGVNPAAIKTWSQFISAAKKVKASGVDAMCGSFAASSNWTSQVLLLADHHNVEKDTPGFAAKLTANTVKYAVDGAGLSTWNKLEETAKLGLYNKDAATTNYDEVKQRMGNGKCGFYPMVTWFTNDVPAELRANIGLIAVPGAKSADYGITTWMPNANYIPANSKHIAEAKKFVAFLTTKKATDARVKASVYTGPFVTKDQSPAPASAPLATRQLATLLKGKTTPAAEFLSPVKGPNLANITAQVLTGQISAEEGAALYDRDNVAQAKQLGLKGW